MTRQQKRHSQGALNDPSAKTSLTGGTKWLFRCLDYESMRGVRIVQARVQSTTLCRKTWIVSNQLEISSTQLETLPKDCAWGPKIWYLEIEFDSSTKACEACASACPPLFVDAAQTNDRECSAQLIQTKGGIWLSTIQVRVKPRRLWKIQPTSMRSSQMLDMIKICGNVFECFATMRCTV